MSARGPWARRIGFVVLVAFDARVAWAVVHAVVHYHLNTGLFWSSIGLLCAVFFIVLWVLRRLARSLR